MVLQYQDVIDEDDLTDADRAILDVLHAGARTKGAIVDETGLHRNTVGNRLDALKFGEAIETIHDRTALYELIEDPRGETNDSDGDQPKIDAVCDDLLHALENREWDIVEDAATKLGCIDNK